MNARTSSGLEVLRTRPPLERMLRIHQAIQAGGCAYAHDPQPAEIAFPRLPVSIGVTQSFLDRLLGKFVQLALIEVIAFCQAEQLLPAIMPFRSAFYSRHW